LERQAAGCINPQHHEETQVTDKKSESKKSTSGSGKGSGKKTTTHFVGGEDHKNTGDTKYEQL
jgi:hypothetical protein